MHSIFRKTKHWLVAGLGLDRAIAASSLTQLIRFVTGPITMVLMIRYFTPEEQGFFYSFAGVVGLQVFLEAGFAQSITQFTSKEFASLRFNSTGALTGDPAALSRLRSLLAQANRYYRSMAVVLIMVLSIGGYWFFSSKPSYDVPWQIPWFVVCFSSGFGFLLTPYWALLEGCNRVAQVATYRFWATVGGFAVMAMGLMLGLGIYVVVCGSLFNLIFPVAYLTTRWRKVLLQVLRPPGRYLISWREDVWGFQWRTVFAWFGGYALSSAIPLMAFQIFGPVVAGQVGMVAQITRMGCGIATNWTVTKMPYLGALHAKASRATFDEIWAAGARRHLIIAFIYQGCFLCGLSVLPWLYPLAAQRLLRVHEAAGFSIGTALASLVLIYAHYCRACRIESFMWINVGMAIGLIFGVVTFGPLIGVEVIGYSFGVVHLIAAMLSRKIWKKQLPRLWPSALQS